MSSFFPDWKYFELIAPGRHAPRDRALNLRSKCLREVSGSFFENVARTDSFSWFPAEVAMRALRHQLCRDYAIFKVTGKLSLRKRSFDEKTRKAINKELGKIRKAKHKQFMAGKDDNEKLRLTEGVSYINRLLRTSMGANQSMEAILFSEVIEAWTAFETLAADLWFTALDHGPTEWRIRTFENQKEFKKKLLRNRHGVPADLQSNFGSFLKDNDFVSFQKIRFIKFWYKTALGKDVETLFKENRFIFALSAVRNVIVHRAGVADGQYMNAVKTFPELSAAKQGKLIDLNGEIVRELRNTAINLGNDLLLFVDDVLISPSG